MSDNRNLRLDTDTSESDDNNLRCPQCLIRFTNPKFLACTHTFCLECLESLVQENEEGEDVEQSKISCPTCGEVTKLKNKTAASLHPNYILQNLINSIDGKSSKIPKCGECIESTSSSEFCYDCKMPMCESCAQHHLKSKRYTRHRMDDIESVKPEVISTSSQYCPTHNELLKYFCKECSLIVCHDCLISKTHVKHERGLIAEVLEETKAELTTLISKGEEESTKVSQFFVKIDSALVESAGEKDKSIKVIEKAFNTVFEVLKEEKQKLLNKVTDPYNKTKKAVDQAKLKRQVLNDMLQYASKLLTSEQNNNLEALSGVITLLTDSLVQCELKEGEKQKVNFVLQNYRNYFDHLEPMGPQTDADGNLSYLSTDGRYYYQSPDGEYFLGYRDGVYYDELDNTGYYEFARKKLASNSKVGSIDINVDRVHAEVKEATHNQFMNSCKTLSI